LGSRRWPSSTEGPGSMKGTPKLMIPATLSGCTTVVRCPGIAPKSFPTRKACYKP